MHMAFQKTLGDGATYFHIAPSWDELKYKITQTEDFGVDDWDGHHFSWEKLRKGDLINDGISLWRYIDDEFAESGIELFNGRIVFLIEIDPDYL